MKQIKDIFDDSKLKSSPYNNPPKPIATKISKGDGVNSPFPKETTNNLIERIIDLNLRSKAEQRMLRRKKAHEDTVNAHKVIIKSSPKGITPKLVENAIINDVVNQMELAESRG